MHNKPIIAVDHVTKTFRRGPSPAARLDLLRLFGGASDPGVLHALDDVDFRVERGEVVGIIGHNGAGKSTLLKILSRVSVPTHGAVRVDGTVAPLIELGAGLVGDLTGRDNIHLNAAILGMSRNDIARKFDDIVAFAELEEFLDTPLKAYSSGMAVRLGFSIATAVECDILIVDEVLAVGDLAFQRKCLDRMETLIRRDGRTVLLVSHNVRQVHRLCTRVLLLDHGRLVADGHPEDVCARFFELSNAKVAGNRSAARNDARVAASGEVDLLAIELVDRDGRKVEAVPCGGELRARLVFRANEPLVDPELIVGTHTTDSVYLAAGSTRTLGVSLSFAPGVHEIEYAIPAFPLVPGVYCLRFSVYDRHQRPIFTGESLASFRVTGASHEAREPGARLLQLPGSWRVNGRTATPTPAGAAPAVAREGGSL